MRNPHGGYYDETKINRCEPTKPPPVMTEKHVKTIEGWATYMEMLNALTDDKHSLDDALARTREVASLVSSLISDEVVVVKREEIEEVHRLATILHLDVVRGWHKEVGDNAHRLNTIVRRWLTLSSGEER
jgi:hypothetical protein